MKPRSSRLSHAHSIRGGKLRSSRARTDCRDRMLTDPPIAIAALTAQTARPIRFTAGQHIATPRWRKQALFRGRGLPHYPFPQSFSMSLLLVASFFANHHNGDNGL